MKAANIAFLLLILAVSVSAGLGLATPRSQFHAWKQQYHKTYASAGEESHAFENFRATLARLRKHAANGAHGMGLNALSDLSVDEFRARFLSGFVRHAEWQQLPVSLPSRAEIEAAPQDFDWRTYQPDVITPVKDQGGCGSCWAIGATECVESMWVLANVSHSQVLLSPQQTVDCDTVDNGCHGGDAITALQYMAAHGVEDEADYPYTSGDTDVNGTCVYNAKFVKVSLSGNGSALMIPSCNDSCTDQAQYEDALKAVVAAGSSGLHGPPAIAVNSAPWLDWNGPEPLDADCDPSAAAIDHEVQLVGYNFSAPVPYWIVRNSWGSTEWGIAGYIYLKAGINQCGLLDEVLLATIASAPAPHHGQRTHSRAHHL